MKIEIETLLLIVSGVAIGVSLILSLFGTISMFFTRRNIINILDRDQLLFDKNFEMKKDAFTDALNIVDMFKEYGVKIRDNKDFCLRAKMTQQQLVCIIKNPKIVEMFNKFCFDSALTEIDDKQITIFKNLCRNEMGYKKGINFQKFFNINTVTDGKNIPELDIPPVLGKANPPLKKDEIQTEPATTASVESRQMAPGQRSVAPGQRPTAPAGQRPMAPGQRPMAPGQRPVAPGQRPMAPGQRPMAPGQRPTAPAGQRPVAPAGQKPTENK